MGRRVVERIPPDAPTGAKRVARGWTGFKAEGAGAGGGAPAAGPMIGAMDDARTAPDTPPGPPPGPRDAQVAPSAPPPRRARTLPPAALWLAILASAAVFVSVSGWLPGLLGATPPAPEARLDFAVESSMRLLAGLGDLAPGQEGRIIDRSRPEEGAPAPDRIAFGVLERHLGLEDEAEATLASVLADLDAADARGDAGADAGVWRDVAATLTGRTGDGAFTDDEAAMLEERLGWVGRLATADESDRAEMASGARRTALAFVGFLLVAVAALVAGLACSIVALIGVSGRVRSTFGRGGDGRDGAGSAYLESFALFLAGMALISAAGVAAEALLSDDQLAAVPFVLFGAQWSLLALAWWPLARGVRGRDANRAIGWTGGRGVVREVAAGVFGYLAGLPLVVAGIVAMFVLIMVTGVQPSHPAQDMARSGHWLNLVMLFGLASVWAPLVEEVFFRGALQEDVRRRAGLLVAVVVTAVLFAGIHPQGVVGMPPLIALAVVFSLLRAWRGSLIAPIVAHALHNSALITMAVLVFGGS